MLSALNPLHRLWNPQGRSPRGRGSPSVIAPADWPAVGRSSRLLAIVRCPSRRHSMRIGRVSTRPRRQRRDYLPATPGGCQRIFGRREQLQRGSAQTFRGQGAARRGPHPEPGHSPDPHPRLDRRADDDPHRDVWSRSRIPRTRRKIFETLRLPGHSWHKLGRMVLDRKPSGYST